MRGDGILVELVWARLLKRCWVRVRHIQIVVGCGSSLHPLSLRSVIVTACSHVAEVCAGVQANVRLARAGAGLTLGDQSRVRAGLASGDLVAVLEEYSTPFLGFYLYDPQRRHASPALRALVDYLRSVRGRSPRRKAALRGGGESARTPGSQSG